MPQNLFGEPYDEPRVKIEDNPLLQTTCNHLLDLTKRFPNLLDGKTVGEIDRKIMLAIWMENGVTKIVRNGSVEDFIAWAKKPKLCISEELVSRARRYLLEHDMIRINASAIQEAERHRLRIAKSVKH